MMCRSDPAKFVNVVLWVAVSAGMSATAADSQTLDDLAFMAGSWSGRTGQVEMEEIWTVPKGGIMLGLHRETSVLRIPQDRGARRRSDLYRKPEGSRDHGILAHNIR
jgi:hypothetical protein